MSAPDLFPVETRPVPKSPKQRAIIAAVAASPNGTITLADAVALVGGDVYANADKHTGALLSNMAKRGILVRVMPGVFKAGKDDSP